MKLDPINPEAGRVYFTGKHGRLSTETVPELNLLAHAQIVELEVGSRCGGYGECGGDRIKILKGAEHLSPPTVAERQHLSAEELKIGIRLACQTFPQNAGAVIEIASTRDGMGGSAL